jgi:hypothetical protein
VREIRGGGEGTKILGRMLGGVVGSWGVPVG